MNLCNVLLMCQVFLVPSRHQHLKWRFVDSSRFGRRRRFQVLFLFGTESRTIIFGLAKLPWVNSFQQILHHAVGNLLGARIMDAQEIGNAFPELTQSLHHTGKRTDSGSFFKHTAVALHNLLLLSTQSLCSPATRERCKHFIGNFVIILKLWVQFLFLCQYGCPLHQTDNVPPFRRIAFAYGDGPQGAYSWISVSAVAILGSV